MVVTGGEVYAKASSTGRESSRGKLESRFGLGLAEWKTSRERFAAEAAVRQRMNGASSEAASEAILRRRVTLSPALERSSSWAEAEERLRLHGVWIERATSDTGHLVVTDGMRRRSVRRRGEAVRPERLRERAAVLDPRAARGRLQEGLRRAVQKLGIAGAASLVARVAPGLGAMVSLARVVRRLHQRQREKKRAGRGR